MIQMEDFQKIDMRIGEIKQAKINQGARKKAYFLTIDFGEELGVKNTSAQITDLYQPEDLIGKKIVAVVNFPPIKIASCKSEVLVLGVDTKKGVALLEVSQEVENGKRVY